jgi:ABC-type Na+ efflux pump permease subunit
MVAQMAKQGITPAIAKNLAIIELVSAILFLLPRTSVLGTLLLTAYMGGAIATHVTTAQPLLAPCVIMAIIWIVSVWRNPELKTRLLG